MRFYTIKFVQLMYLHKYYYSCSSNNQREKTDTEFDQMLLTDRTYTFGWFEKKTMSKLMSKVFKMLC